MLHAYIFVRLLWIATSPQALTDEQVDLTFGRLGRPKIAVFHKRRSRYRRSLLVDLLKGRIA